MALKYHHALFALLEQEPRLSEGALRKLEEQEQAQGVRFPESVREWFSLEGVGELFAGLTNSDELVGPAELKIIAHDGRLLLHVATENQGVYYWFVDCNGSDDPPVLDDDNGIDWDDQENFDFSHVTWRVSSYSFSSFIFAMLTGTRFGQGFRLSATDSSPAPDVLASLRTDFLEGPWTSVPEKHVYRFAQPDADLIIRSNTADELARGIAHWYLIAPTPDALAKLAKRVWPFGTLAKTLQSVGVANNADAERRILAQLTQEGSS